MLVDLRLLKLTSGVKLIQYKNTMPKLSNKKISVFLLISYLYLAVFGLAGVTSHNHVSETPCPYMMGLNVVCEMDNLSHISFWKFLLSVFPSSIFILLFFIYVYYVTSKLFYISPQIMRSLLYFKNNKLKPIYIRVEEDYSDGRINRKPY